MKKNKNKKKRKKKNTKENGITSRISGRWNTAAVGDDFRKIGVNVMTVGIIGAIVLEDKILPVEGLTAVVLGAIFWLMGLRFCRIAESKQEDI